MIETVPMLSELTRLAEALAGTELAVPDVKIWRATRPTPPTPALFEPVLYVVLQGAKRMTSAGMMRTFERGVSAVACVGLPFVHQVIEASPERPYLGVQVRLDPALLAELMLAMPDQAVEAVDSFGTGPVDAIVLDPLLRLLRLLTIPADAPVLAPAIMRELCYRLLQGPMSGTLRQVGRRGSRFAQIRAAADWIGAHPFQPLRIPELALSVGMSVTSLHRHFKTITGYSPLAYQRYLRLVEARRMLIAGDQAVSSVGFAVGYASVSQFSREYKQMFGGPPVADLRGSRSSPIAAEASTVNA